MTGIEKIAYTNTKYAYNYIVGGHYNIVQDESDPEYLPKNLAELKEDIYTSALNNLYHEGYEGYGKAPKEMRFAGESFIRKVIDNLCEKDEYGELAEIAEYANW